MVTLSTSGNAIAFTFTDSDKYLYGNGTITVPKNSLLLVTDSSEMATFKKAASNDIFVSALYSELGKSKSELITWFEQNAVSSGGGGGGGGVDTGTVQTMIDSALEDYSTTDEITSAITSATDDMATETWVGEQGYITGVDLSNYAEISAVTAVDDVLTAHTANTDIHVTTAQTASWDAKSDFSGSYNDLTDKPTIPTVPTSNTAFTNDAGYITSDALSGYAETTAVTAVDNVLTAHTADTNIHVTTAQTAAWDAKQDALVSGTNIKTINNESILGSGNITIQGGGGGNNTVELTQAEYDALVSAGTVSADTYYIITDAPSVDMSNYVQTSAMTAALSGKVDTSAIVTAVTSASTDSEIPTAKAVFDAIPTGSTGGGATYTAGTNISIDTANTISCTLPISSPTGWYGITVGNYGGQNQGYRHIVGGLHCNAIPKGNSYTPDNCIVIGSYLNVYNSNEASFGKYNNSVQNTGVGGESGTTLFSIGNGTSNNARHNALEIRQNGDIYCNNGTSDVKLQDYLQIKVMAISQSDYDALVQGGTVDANTLYVITNVVS